MQEGSLGGLGWWRDVFHLKNVLPSFGCHRIVIRVLPSAFFSCALTVNVIDLLFLRQCLMGLQSLVRHRFAAIRGTVAQYRTSLRLCQLTFARALLEHIVHRTCWLRQLPGIALQGRIAQKGQQLLHRVPQGIIAQSPRHFYLVLQVLSSVIRVRH
jgi:hypothetical protein